MLLLSDFEDLLTFKGWTYLTWQMKIESTLFYLMSAYALNHEPFTDSLNPYNSEQFTQRPRHTAENSRNYTTHFSIDFARVSEKQRR